MPLYESGLVAYHRGAPAPGAPVVPTPLSSCTDSLILSGHIPRLGCYHEIVIRLTGKPLHIIVNFGIYKVLSLTITPLHI